MEINDWEQDLKTVLFISLDDINEQFGLLTKTMIDLAKEALLAKVEFSMCGQISY